MDQVLPGLNNVARHIRPFVVVAWAWRRAKRLAERDALHAVQIDLLQDFVDRIEVVYAWSQFLRKSDADLPGRQVLSSLIQADRWTFGGPAWERRCKERRDSTAFTAAINYGPALKAFGWVDSYRENSRVLIPTASAAPALDAFEAQIADRIDHPVFNRLGDVDVMSTEIRDWADGWALERTTDAERRLMAEMLFGVAAPLKRRKGGALIRCAAIQGATIETNSIRKLMAGAPTKFAPPAELDDVSKAWRSIQIRQLFRLSLEATLFWMVRKLEIGPQSIGDIVDAFVSESGDSSRQTSAAQWLNRAVLAEVGPVTLMERIEQSFDPILQSSLVPHILDGLAFCLSEAPMHGFPFERNDRLPLSRARREAEAWSSASPKEFSRHILETWVLAQHVYWSVGRGLADARARRKTILRLKVVLEASPRRHKRLCSGAHSGQATDGAQLGKRV